MKESEVENALIAHWQRQKYLTFPDKTEPHEWGKFSIFDGKVWEPDVVGFRWEDAYSLSIKAAECKGSGTLGAIRSAIKQATTYQAHFPLCYVCTPEPKYKDWRSTLEFIRSGYHLGYIPVDEKDKPEVTRRGFKDISDKKYTNTSLRVDSYRISRQRIVMFSTFHDLFPESKIRVFFKGHGGHTNTLGDFQYNSNNYTQNRSIQFGINVETKKSVKRVLRENIWRIMSISKSLELGDMILEFRREVYSGRRPKVPMETPVLMKPVEDVDKNDAKYMEGKIDKWDNSIHFTLQKEIWSENDFLSRTEHRKRMTQIWKPLEELRRDIGQ